MSKTKTHEKIKMFIKEHLPIGYRAEKERTAFLTSLICPVIFSLTFLVNYSREKENIYRYIAGGFRKELIPGAVMENFADVLGYSMTAFCAYLPALSAFQPLCLSQKRKQCVLHNAPPAG